MRYHGTRCPVVDWSKVSDTGSDIGSYCSYSPLSFIEAYYLPFASSVGDLL